MEENQITVRETNVMENNSKGIYCTKPMGTTEEKIEMLNVLESDMPLLNDCVGQELELAHVYIEPGTRVDENSGEVRDKYRTILFDVSGQTYATGSYGIYNILKKLIGLKIFIPGENTVKVQVAKRSIGSGKQSLTLQIIK